MQLLGGKTAHQFLSRHWQKRPLLVRNAIPDFKAVTQAAELFRLAADDDVESRIVSRQRGKWSIAHGPFRAADFKRMPAVDWTLLVQGLNLHNTAADRLLHEFSFIPYARLDDVMASYAVPGGGVGPHIDSYDVFLLQGMGRRLWRIGPPRNANDTEFVENIGLRILKHFEPEEEYLVENGDLLYLPPGWAHDGIALDNCITYSIGFRAPARRELAAEFLTRYAEGLDLPGLYRDPDLQVQSKPSAIPAAMVTRTAELLSTIRFTRRDVSRFLGEYLSEPKPRIVFTRPRTPLAPARFRDRLRAQGARLDPRTLMLHSARELYINGEQVAIAPPQRAQLLRLADDRTLPPGRHDEALCRMLHDWYIAGWLHPGTDA